MIDSIVCIIQDDNYTRHSTMKYRKIWINLSNCDSLLVLIIFLSQIMHQCSRE